MQITEQAVTLGLVKTTFLMLLMNFVYPSCNINCDHGLLQILFSPFKILAFYFSRRDVENQAISVVGHAVTFYDLLATVQFSNHFKLHNILWACDRLKFSVLCGNYNFKSSSSFEFTIYQMTISRKRLFCFNSCTFGCRIRIWNEIHAVVSSFWVMKNWK